MSEPMFLFTARRSGAGSALGWHACGLIHHHRAIQNVLIARAVLVVAALRGAGRVSAVVAWSDETGRDLGRTGSCQRWRRRRIAPLPSLRVLGAPRCP